MQIIEKKVHELPYGEWNFEYETVEITYGINSLRKNNLTSPFLKQ